MNDQQDKDRKDIGKDLMRDAVSAMQSASYYEEHVAEQASLNAFKRMVMVFFSPGAVFRDIERDPKGWTPFFVIGIFSVITVIMQMDAYVALVMQTYIDRGMPIEQLEEGIQTVKGAMLVSTPLMLMAGIFVKTGFSIFLAGPLGAEPTFNKTFAVITYAYMIQILGLVLKSVATLMTGTYGLSFSPAMMVDMNGQPLLYMLLSNFDVFNIWYLGLSILGFSMIAKISKTKSALAILTPTVLFVIVMACMVMISSPK